MLNRCLNKSAKKVAATYLFAVCIIISIFIGGCAPKYEVVTPELRTKFMDDLKNGNLTLTCETECSWSWVTNFQKLVQLHNSYQWHELAEQVMQIGFVQDLSYYYLGRSAEGLGYYDGALKFYKHSLDLYFGPNNGTTIRHCRDNSSLGCADLDLAAVIPERIAVVEALIKEQSKPFGYLAKLEGKDPVRENLWADSKFMEKLEATLGKQRAKQLVTGWGKGDPAASAITRVDDNLVFAACKPNDQCYHQVIIFIGITDGTVEACWQDASSSKSLSDFWLSPGGKSRKLPAGYCEMHEDTDLSKMFSQNTSDKRKR